MLDQYPKHMQKQLLNKISMLFFIIRRGKLYAVSAQSHPIHVYYPFNVCIAGHQTSVDLII